MGAERPANERRKAEKRKAIVGGAIKAFQKEGFERASMDLVAELAGASKRTVYNHFKSKKDGRIKVKDPELAAQVFRGLVEGGINLPALYGPLKTARELKPVKDEVIAVFLSRYRG